MKNWKHCILVGILAIFVGVLVFSGSADTLLSGTWENEYGGNIQHTIEFDGENFTLTEYPVFGQPYAGEDPEWFPTSPIGDINNFGNEWKTFKKFKSIPGKLKYDIYLWKTTGTYSISGDGFGGYEIEMVFSKSGNIYVHSFSRTQNTMTIDRYRFLKKK